MPSGFLFIFRNWFVKTRGIKMAAHVKIGLAQLNMTVGDVKGNTEAILKAAESAKDLDILLTPELSLCGYPPKDLLLLNQFIEDTKASLERLAEQSKKWPNLHLAAGLPFKENGKLYNAAALIHNGKILGIEKKSEIVDSGSFKESKYFAASTDKPLTFEVREHEFALAIGEDAFSKKVSGAALADKPITLLSIHASAFTKNKFDKRLELAKSTVQSGFANLVYLNLVGGEDESVFDGRSFVMNAKGEVAVECKAFSEELSVVELKDNEVVPAEPKVKLSKVELLYGALVCSVRDYIRKNKFKGIVLGLSGGVDSALVLKISADAIGADKVMAVMMPSVYTSNMSRADAQQLAKNLGVTYKTISISPAYSAFEVMLSEEFSGLAKDVTEENLQARSRAMLLMALSNKFGTLVTTTGNKSESAVGYATLYGDLAGGFAPIKDIYKTEVYEICHWLNKDKSVFPETILTRAPTAELREDQRDQDSLPEYGMLDKILYRLVEQRQSPKEVVSEGLDKETVDKVFSMLVRAEYKRQQAPVGPKLSEVAFGIDWTYPITNHYR